jgi:hypothetical protein
MAHLDTLTERFGGTTVLGGVAVISATANDDGDIVVLAPAAMQLRVYNNRLGSARP